MNTNMNKMTPIQVLITPPCVTFGFPVNPREMYATLSSISAGSTFTLHAVRRPDTVVREIETTYPTLMERLK